MSRLSCAPGNSSRISDRSKRQRRASNTNKGRALPHVRQSMAHDSHTSHDTETSPGANRRPLRHHFQLVSVYTNSYSMFYRKKKKTAGKRKLEPEYKLKKIHDVSFSYEENNQKASPGFPSLNKKVCKEKPGICQHRGKHPRTKARGQAVTVRAGRASGAPGMGGLSIFRDRAAPLQPSITCPIHPGRTPSSVLPSSPARGSPRSRSCLLGAAVATVAQRVGRAAGVQHLDPQGADGPH